MGGGGGGVVVIVLQVAGGLSDEFSRDTGLPVSAKGGGDLPLFDGIVGIKCLAGLDVGRLTDDCWRAWKVDSSSCLRRCECFHNRSCG